MKQQTIAPSKQEVQLIRALLRNLMQSVCSTVPMQQKVGGRLDTGGCCAWREK
jgi:hypothetical protein